MSERELRLPPSPAEWEAMKAENAKLRARCEELALECVASGELHLADEQTIRQLEGLRAEVERLMAQSKVDVRAMGEISAARDAAFLQNDEMKKWIREDGHNHTEEKPEEWFWCDCSMCKLQKSEGKVWKNASDMGYAQKPKCGHGPRTRFSPSPAEWEAMKAENAKLRAEVEKL